MRASECRDSCDSASRESVCLPYEHLVFVVGRSRDGLDATSLTFAFAFNLRPLEISPRGLVGQWSHGASKDSRQDGTVLEIRHGRQRVAARARKWHSADALLRLVVGLAAREDRPPAFAFDVHLNVEFLRCSAAPNASFASMPDVAIAAQTICLIDFDRFTCVAPLNVRTSLHQQVCHFRVAARLRHEHRRSSNFSARPGPPEAPIIHQTHWPGFNPHC